MSADIFKFEEFAGSGRGLLCRLMLPGDVVGYRADVASIAYQILNITDSSTVATGSLDPADVMSTTLVAWSVDKIGRTFKWEVPGSMWAVADKTIRVIVSFTLGAAHGSNIIKEVWEIKTVSPTT